MKAHFITFLSPGTFVAEETEKPIASWDVDKAIEMSKKIKERYGAVPYGFYFTTRERTDQELDSKEVARSPMYYLGGKVQSLAQVKAENNPKNEILIANMEGNGWNRIITNTNSWRWTQPLRKGDIVLKLERK